MLHHPKRIQLVERWSRGLAWFNLLSGIISIGLKVYIQMSNENETANVNSFIYRSFQYQINMILNYLTPLVIILKNFLLLWGVSIVVRFLQGFYAQITAVE